MKVIVFGASMDDKSFYEQINNEHKIIAFCDNDQNKHSKGGRLSCMGQR